jgi:hypothetical protein
MMRHIIVAAIAVGPFCLLGAVILVAALEKLFG